MIISIDFWNTDFAKNAFFPDYCFFYDTFTLFHFEAQSTASVQSEKKM